MNIRARAAAFARRKWKHLIAGHAVLAGAIALAFVLGVFAGPATTFGQHLDAKGEAAYKRIATNGLEFGQKTLEHESLPPAQAKAIAKLNNQVAAGFTHPNPLATPEPSFTTSLVRNFSDRAVGAHVELWAVHDTESPNTPGSLQGARAIVSWFNNPASQASSNYVTDCAGNTILMVPTTKKAWHVAWFNSWSIGDELIGHANQTKADWMKCDAQLRAAAQLAAHDMTAAGIPIQRGLVRGCTIIRPGVVEHADLGSCGGGHHDPGTNFPIDYFIGLVKAYSTGGYHPKPHPKPKPVKPAVAPAVLRAKTGYWSWLGWRLGEAAWKGYGKTNPTVRPHVAKTVPHAWWIAAAAHMGAR